MTDRVMTRNMKALASGGEDEQRSDTSLIDLMRNSCHHESKAQENKKNAENSTQPKMKSPRYQEPLNARKTSSEDQHLGFRGSDRSRNYGLEPSEYPSFNGSEYEYTRPSVNWQQNGPPVYYHDAYERQPHRLDFVAHCDPEINEIPQHLLNGNINRQRPSSYLRRYQVPANRRNENFVAQFKLNLPRYDGKTRWQTFYHQFEAVTQDWSEDKKLYHLLSCLTADAADFVFELESHVRDSYHSLTEELDRRFKTIETPQMCARQFYRRKLRSGETIKQFASELKSLVRKAYPQGLDRSAMERMMIKQFFDGLDDDDLRYNIEYLKMPKGLDEAIELVHEHDQFKRINRENVKQKVNAVQPSPGQRPQSPASSVPNQSYANEIKEIKLALTQLTNQVDKLMNSQQQGRKCYKCGREGHFKRACPETSEQVKAVSAYYDVVICDDCQSDHPDEIDVSLVN